jgi:cell shape-determining protein MreD
VMILTIAASIYLALAMCVQAVLPGLALAHQSRLLVAPVMFFAAAAAVPFPAMLLMALVLGLVWDTYYLIPVIDAGVEGIEGIEGIGGAMRATSDLGFGYSAVLFAFAGSIMQGVRPFFRRGRWELPVLLVGVLVFLWLLAEFLLLTFLRGEFEFSSGVWTKLISSSLLACFLAPASFFLLHLAAQFSRGGDEEPRPYLFHGP